MEKRYNAFSDYLKQKFGAKVYKITLDAGFSCPNRDGTISKNGCIFCDDGGSFSQAHSNKLSIEEQVITGIETLTNRFKAQKFMSYFQAFSNTYKPVQELENIYTSALNHPDIVGLSIGTRPDCVDDEKLKLISSFTKDYYTWLEYGLQTIHDKTLIKINRGHDYKCFLETYDEMMQTAQTIAKLEPDGVKIHMLCALEGTKLAEMYNTKEIDFMSQEEYVKTVCDFLEFLPPQTTIHRLAGNGLRTELVAPRWIGKKLDTLNKIDREFIVRNSKQGIKFNLY